MTPLKFVIKYITQNKKMCNFIRHCTSLRPLAPLDYGLYILWGYQVYWTEIIGTKELEFVKHCTGFDSDHMEKNLFLFLTCVFKSVNYPDWCDFPLNKRKCNRTPPFILLLNIFGHQSEKKELILYFHVMLKLKVWICI